MAGALRVWRNGLRLSRRSGVLLGALALWSSLPAGLAAQTPKVFSFGSKPVFVKAEVYENSIDVRPNGSVALYVFATSVRELPNAYVELWGPGDTEKPWGRSAPLKFKGGDTLRVQFAKAEEKKPVKPPEPPAAAPAAPAAAPPAPPPPGRVLPYTKNAAFELRLIEVVDNAPKVVTKEEIAINVLSPNQYLNVEATSRGSNLEVTVSTRTNDATKKAFQDGSASVVTLVIPPQPNLDVRDLGPGTYRRTLAAAGKTITLNAKELPLPRERDSSVVRFYVEADGYPRAFIFQPALNDFDRDEGKVQLSSTEDVRVYPGNVTAEAAGNLYYARPTARPEDRYPVRVELDNARAESVTDVTFYRAGDTSRDEVATLNGSRETKVWVDPASEDGQFVITNKLTDWVVPLDTYMLRGTYRVNAAFGPGKEISLALDDTGPNVITFGLPDEHIKGTALKVAATVQDRENTPIRRVIFTFGPPPGPDGKRAAEPIKVEGVRDPVTKNLWLAAFPLAPEVKGVLEVGAVATNQVGLEMAEAKLIKLVDPPAALGSLAVKVLRGARPQPGVNVQLRDAEGKEKSVLTTEKDGVVIFKNLTPGLYTVLAGKPDSSAGSKAAMSAKVEGGPKPTEVDLVLKRGP